MTTAPSTRESRRIDDIVSQIGDSRATIAHVNGQHTATIIDPGITVTIRSIDGRSQDYVRATDASGRTVIMDFFSDNTRRTILAVRAALAKYGATS